MGFAGLYEALMWLVIFREAHMRALFFGRVGLPIGLEVLEFCNLILRWPLLKPASHNSDVGVPNLGCLLAGCLDFNYWVSMVFMILRPKVYKRGPEGRTDMV